MNSPIPNHIRKAPARKTEVSTPSSTAFEYFKFWAPFLVTVIAVSAMLMARISVLEAVVDDLKTQVVRLEEKTLGKDVLAARYEDCQRRHETATARLNKMEAEIDRRFEAEGKGR